MKKTTAITTVVLIPTTFATSSSSPMARTALPKEVRLSSSQRPANPTSATTMVKTLKPLMVAPAIVTGSLPKASGSGLGAASKTIVVAAVMASSTPSEATSMINGERARAIM